MKTIIIVVRHGETEWNAIGKQQGQLDSPLTASGIKQAEAIAKAVTSGFDLLVSSDLGRAVQTAQIIGEHIGLDIIQEPGLRERHLGMIQGHTMAEFQEQHPIKYEKFKSEDPDFVIPEGESVRQRYERGVEAFTRIAKANPGKRILVVTHGGILESLLRHTLQMPIHGKRTFSLVNGSLNTFSYDDGWTLESWGLIAHLQGLNALDDF
ncbi:MAG: histidine phosphatase family protein [Spirochaetales bacterium]|nr:histidine phosphatase family protein [Spirochaetales bacterium]